MDANAAVIVGVAAIATVTLGGFFWTKTRGFGRFTTSTLLVLLVLLLTSIFFAAGKLDTQAFTSVVFAVVGFAGGLFTGKADTSKNGD